MEKEAHERDQISWACSAQNDKLLPKTSSPQKNKAAVAEKIKARVAPQFEEYFRANPPIITEPINES